MMPKIADHTNLHTAIDRVENSGIIFLENRYVNVTLRELKKSLPDPHTHRLYFDFGTGTNDGSIEPFQQQVDALLKETGYVDGKNWVTQKFPGEEHSERAWRKRVHLPLQFLPDEQRFGK